MALMPSEQASSYVDVTYYYSAITLNAGTSTTAVLTTNSTVNLSDYILVGAVSVRARGDQRLSIREFDAINHTITVYNPTSNDINALTTWEGMVCRYLKK